MIAPRGDVERQLICLPSRMVAQLLQETLQNCCTISPNHLPNYTKSQRDRSKMRYQDIYATANAK